MAKHTITIIVIVKNDCITGIEYGEVQITVSPLPQAKSMPTTYHKKQNKIAGKKTAKASSRTASYNKMQHKGRTKPINIKQIIVCAETQTTRQARRAYRQALALLSKRVNKRTKQK